MGNQDYYVVRVDGGVADLLMRLLSKEEERLTTLARTSSWEEQDRAIADLVQLAMTKKAINRG